MWKRTRTNTYTHAATTTKPYNHSQKFVNLCQNRTQCSVLYCRHVVSLSNYRWVIFNRPRLRIRRSPPRSSPQDPAGKIHIMLCACVFFTSTLRTHFCWPSLQMMNLLLLSHFSLSIVNDTCSSFPGETPMQHLHANHLKSISFMGICIWILFGYVQWADFRTDAVKLWHSLTSFCSNQTTYFSYWRALLSWGCMRGKWVGSHNHPKMSK